MFVLYIFIIVHFVTQSAGKEFIMEAVNNRTKENHKLVPFKNATHHKALYVTSGMPFSINFCLRQRSFVSVKNIRFLNFNSSTFISVYANEKVHYGTYFAVGHRNKSDIFVNTGPIGSIHELLAGWNVLKLNLVGSAMVLDTFLLEVDDNKMNYLIFNCEAVCKERSNFPVDIPAVTAATMTQNSFYTKCAEVDNIDIPIYHPHVKEFSVTATLPQYRSFANRLQANLTDCPHLSQTLWSFDNFTMSPTSHEISNHLVFLTFHKVRVNFMEATLIFRLEGESNGSINTDMGSQLFLRFTHLAGQVNVTMNFKHKNGSMVNSGKNIFNVTCLEHMWEIQDFSWVESDYNYITLQINTKLSLDFQIYNLRLDRRPFIPDQTVTLYKSDDVIIEGVLVDMWWRGHERMTINLSDGSSHEGFAFFRFYRPIPWTEGYCQVFILYQDGNARLLPVSPEGLEWIPFGTSVIVGQVKRDSKRPYVSISQVDISPEDWKLVIFFKDGGTLRMKLTITDDYTKAYFDVINFVHDTYLYPFVTVRSMYVEEGNSDVDSVKIDDVTTYNIMDNWGTVQGKSFAFHRRCVSKHLTLSPDIQIGILKTVSTN